MIETLRNIDVTDIDKMINEITGPTSIGYIKSKNGEHIIEKKCFNDEMNKLHR